MAHILHYIHDPMCSWCYGFTQVRKQLLDQLPDTIDVQYAMGGLAPDSDEPMDERTRQYIQKAWHEIENRIPGVSFNFQFWEQNTPRRSTYPACRAVIAAKLIDPACEEHMILRIQQAYYQEAKNPSDSDVLVSLAPDVGLDKEQFKQTLLATETDKLFESQRQFTKQIGANSFPSFFLQIDKNYSPISIDYTDSKPMLSMIKTLINDDQ